MFSVRYLCLLIFSLSELSFVLNYSLRDTESWTGKWFPYPPATNRPHDIPKGEDGRIKMGVVNKYCDDGKTNLTLDWNGSPDDFICFNPRNLLYSDPAIDSIIEYETIPRSYMAPHFCMDTEIFYDEKIPTFGAHRPLWPIYGEYIFLPKQRWLHSLEHGAIVALYHPCAEKSEIALLKKLVKSCLRRHVITPSADLDPSRPLALVAWGVRYTMPAVYPNGVRKFIRDRAKKGPEALAKEGQYKYLLKERAEIVSDFEDTELCPEDKFLDY